MELFRRTIEGSKPHILILHGLYSSSSNWYTVARDLGYEVELVDLPNHGRSAWSDEFGYRAIAEQIKPLIDKPTIVIGHSLGGRIAMILAQELPLLVTGLVVVDISPIALPKVDRAFTMCHAMFLHHLVEARRSGVTDITGYLREHNAPEDMTSAVDQAYRQMNVEVVADNLMKLPAEWLDITSQYGICDTPTLFVRGGNSPYILDLYIEQFHTRYSNFEVATIDSGTHRLHHEYPDKFIAAVRTFIDKSAISLN